MERFAQARQEEVQWCRVPEDMNTEGTKAVSLRWIDTNKGDAGRPNCKSHLVVERSRRPFAAEVFSGMPFLEDSSLCSLNSQEEAIGKRTLAMHDISHAHFHGVPAKSVLGTSG